MNQSVSMCRICTGGCGVVVELDAGRRVRSISGDRAHPVSKGYACSKGLTASILLNSKDRILHPLKRQPDGSFTRVRLADALDEIADRLGKIIEEDGPDGVGLFKGTQTYQNATASQMLTDWMEALGSRNYFTTNTIDQSSHLVTMGRMGFWDAGKQGFEGADVAMLVGSNPLVSLGAYTMLDYDPSRRLKAARKSGLKLIVIDPRRTETAIQADCFLQPVPGQDAVILAGLINIVLQNGWHDEAFCRQYVSGLDALRDAVLPFTLQLVATRTGLDPGGLITAATMFAKDSCRGSAVIGTGGTMQHRSNLADHLVSVLNVICGRMMRPGDRVPNAGVLAARRDFLAEVVKPDRTWESSLKSTTGHGEIAGERMSGILAHEMLHQGPGRIRALFVNGANPAVALPNQAMAVAGLRALDLLVAVEPFMTATAMLCDYIIPPKILYERTDVAKPASLEAFLSGPAFNQYLPALAEPPEGSELIDDWYLYWALAQRLQIKLSFAGVPLSLRGSPPSTDDLLEILFRDSRVALADLKAHPRGKIYCWDDVVKQGSSENQFDIVPSDIAQELAEVLSEPVDAPPHFPFQLIVRRVRHSQNSYGRLNPASKQDAFNALYVHPDDLTSLGIAQGDDVWVENDLDSIPAKVAPDSTLRPGVVSMAHCWGLLPENDRYLTDGSCTSRLVRTDSRVEPINAMPSMTGIGVRIRPTQAGNDSPSLSSTLAACR